MCSNSSMESLSLWLSWLIWLLQNSRCSISEGMFYPIACRNVRCELLELRLKLLLLDYLVFDYFSSAEFVPSFTSSSDKSSEYYREIKLFTFFTFLKSMSICWPQTSIKRKKFCKSTVLNFLCKLITSEMSMKEAFRNCWKSMMRF